jgi:hypothetical protein
VHQDGLAGVLNVLCWACWGETSAVRLIWTDESMISPDELVGPLEHGIMSTDGPEGE